MAKKIHLENSLPVGSLVYTTRHLGLVGVVLPDGRNIPLIQPSDKRAAQFFEGAPFEPYGLAYDEGKDTFWIADKANHRIWRVRFAPLDKIFAKEVSVSEATHFQNSRIFSPCQINIDSKRGLLIGSYGDGPIAGAAWAFDESEWTCLTPPQFEDRISHCIWLPKGGFCYVTRSDWILWTKDSKDEEAHPRTMAVQRNMPPPKGKLNQLWFRYVQGLYWSDYRNALLVADASLGCIFEIDLESDTYKLAAGKPMKTSSEDKANLRAGSSDVWLGPVRALAERPNGDVLWIDGEKGNLMSCNFIKRQILILTSVTDGKPMSGSGIRLI